MCKLQSEVRDGLKLLDDGGEIANSQGRGRGFIPSCEISSLF